MVCLIRTLILCDRIVHALPVALVFTRLVRLPPLQNQSNA